MLKKVLVIDDDDSILNAIELVLEEYNYKVKALKNGNVIYSIIKEFDPDIILLDILISGIDGRKLCKELKENDDYKHIPIITISAHPTAKSELASYGAQEFISKPFEVSELINAINKYTD